MRNLLHTCSSYIAMLLLSAFVAVACTPSVPSDVIQPDEMEDILYDYYISQALAGQALNQKDASYDRYVYFSAVLQKHGVTEAEFDSSLVYYYSNAKRLHGIYSSLSERIGNEAMGLGASVSEFNKYSSLSESGDTANIWQDATSLLLTPYAPSNKFTFSIKADSTYKVGDSFLVNFMSDFIYQAGTKDAVVYVAVRYDNDSVSTHVTHIGVSGVSRLRIPANDESRVSNIDGFVYLNRGSDDSRTLKLLFISQMQFVRFHKKEMPKAVQAKDSVAAPVADTLPARDSTAKATVIPHKAGQAVKVNMEGADARRR